MSEWIIRLLIGFCALYFVLNMITSVGYTGLWGLLEGETTAVITEHDERRYYNKSQAVTSYQYDYDYYVDGKKYSAISSYVSKHLHDGDELVVRYNPDDPSVSMLDVEYHGSLGYIIAIFALVIGLFVLYKFAKV